MTPESGREDDQEFVSRQKSHASAARAQEARAHFETLYEAGVMRKRQEQGMCIFCGGELGWLARGLRSSRHRRCTTFSEP